MGPMEAAIKAIEQSTQFYAKDLDHLSEEQILSSAGGCCRKPVDFTYEVAFINRQIAAQLANREPEPNPEGEEWAVAPAELQSKAAILEYFAKSSTEIIDAAKAVPEADIAKLIGAPGRERPAFALLNFAAMHTMYHDAQINFVQSLQGDDKMHWF